MACHLAPSARLCLLRPEKYWRYDPRFTGSFEDDLELHRDPFRDDGDRRSEHSDHSARSLGAPSRRSSFSTHSQQVGGAVGRLRAPSGWRLRGTDFPHLLCFVRVRFTEVAVAPPAPTRPRLRQAPSMGIMPMTPIAPRASQSTATLPTPAGPPWSKVCAVEALGAHRSAPGGGTCLW